MGGVNVCDYGAGERKIDASLGMYMYYRGYIDFYDFLQQGGERDRDYALAIILFSVYTV